MSTYASAIAFARRGLAVIPLHWPMLVNGKRRCSCKKGADCGISSAKHPIGRLVPEGLLNASTDEAVIRKWFVAEPPANLGVRTDGLIVLDADPRHGGDEMLADLEHAHPFPLTWRVITGGGGEHVIFKCPEGITVNCSNAHDNPVLGPGIDVRAQGGYIVAPPSRHITGRQYAWNVDYHPADVPLAEAPAWLVERLVTSVGNGRAREPIEWAKRKAGIVIEYRDQAIASVAGKLLRAVSIDPSFAATLTHAWNLAHCEPPLSEREVEAILDRVGKREVARLEKIHA